MFLDKILHREQAPPGAIELLMTLLSLLAIIIVLAIMGVPLDPEMVLLLKNIDLTLCLLFQANFWIRLARSKDRQLFFKRYWVDCIASIPVIEQLRWLRIFQLMRVIRTLKNMHALFAGLRRDPAQLAIAFALLFLVVVLGICSVLILHYEQYDDGPITTAGDAIWWGLVTISTVGYGDYYPITPEGKVVGGVLIITGVSMFGTISGLVASQVLHRQQEKIGEKVDLDLREDLRMEQLEIEQKLLLEQLLNEVRHLRQEVAQLKKTDSD